MFENLHAFSLFDEKEWQELPFNEELLIKLLKLFVNTVLPKHLVELEEARNANDWEALQKIAHTLKTSSYYCSSLRLRHFCEYLETCEVPLSEKELNDCNLLFQSAITQTKQVIDKFLVKYEECVVIASEQSERGDP